MELKTIAYPAGGLPAEFCVVVPTYNERSNITELVNRVTQALTGLRWEMIIVDDNSPDGTAAQAHAIHRGDPRVRVLRRIGRRGLASACIEGMLASCAPYLAVIDADLQHDPALLASMFKQLKANEADLVIGSRYVEGGGTGAWTGERLHLSRAATAAVRWLCRLDIADPMSGYFALHRDVFEEASDQLSGRGFKILFDLVMTSRRSLRVVELPMMFGPRLYGESKLSSRVLLDCAMLVACKFAGRVGGAALGPIAPVRSESRWAPGTAETGRQR